MTLVLSELAGYLVARAVLARKERQERPRSDGMEKCIAGRMRLKIGLFREREVMECDTEEGCMYDDERGKGNTNVGIYKGTLVYR